MHLSLKYLMLLSFALVTVPTIVSSIAVAGTETSAAGLREICDKGGAQACEELGFRLQNGTGVRKDDRASAVMHQRACDGGNVVGCYNLGTFYQKGIGVLQDAARATYFYEKSCDGGDAWACVNLGNMLNFGEGVATDKSRAARYYRSACDLADAIGCSNLGEMTNNGDGIPANQAIARGLFSKACSAGNQAACERLRTVAAVTTKPVVEHSQPPRQTTADQPRQQPREKVGTYGGPTDPMFNHDWGPALEWQRRQDRAEAQKQGASKSNFIDAKSCLAERVSTKEFYTGQYTPLGASTETNAYYYYTNTCPYTIFFDAQGWGSVSVKTLAPHANYSGDSPENVRRRVR